MTISMFLVHGGEVDCSQGRCAATVHERGRNKVGNLDRQRLMNTNEKRKI